MSRRLLPLAVFVLAAACHQDHDTDQPDGSVAIDAAMNVDAGPGDAGADLASAPDLLPPPPKTVGVAVSYTHTCSWREDGHVFCWGTGSLEQLGDGMTGARATPYEVPGVTDAQQVATGDGFTCILRTSGKVSCWGRGDMTGLGNTAVQSPKPVDMKNLSDVVEIGAARVNACARTIKGSVYCWGQNANAQTTDPGYVKDPTLVPGLDDTAGVAQVAIGETHICVRFLGGTAKCWGYGQVGRLGVGDEDDRSAPTAVLDLTDAAYIAAGAYATCVTTTAGLVRCWGGGGIAQTTSLALQPVTIASLTDAKKVAVGAFAGCALDSMGTMRCWAARNSFGTVGNGTMSAQPTPATPLGLGAVTAFGASDFNTAAVSGGALYVWGANSAGAVGDGTNMIRLSPKLISY